MRASKGTWKTQDGRVILFADLEDDHLLNILAMLKNNDELRRYRAASGMLLLAAYASDEPEQTICEGMLNELADAEWYEWGKAKEMMDLAVARKLDVSALKEKLSIDEAAYRLVKTMEYVQNENKINKHLPE